jgi:hypothetical protein
MLESDTDHFDPAHLQCEGLALVMEILSTKVTNRLKVDLLLQNTAKLSMTLQRSHFQKARQQENWMYLQRSTVSDAQKSMGKKRTILYLP